MYKLWNEIKRQYDRHESFIPEVFIIENKNDLHITQLPNILVSDKAILYDELCKINKVYKKNYINKALIDEHFNLYSGYGGTKLIILKEEEIYWYINLYFTDLLVIVSKTNRINNMKAFW